MSIILYPGLKHDYFRDPLLGLIDRKLLAMACTVASVTGTPNSKMLPHLGWVHTHTHTAKSVVRRPYTNAE
jgi:hypothetical protein